jgi:hypothetical protein
VPISFSKEWKMKTPPQQFVPAEILRLFGIPEETMIPIDSEALAEAMKRGTSRQLILDAIRDYKEELASQRAQRDEEL